uniref:Ig-like domain-containing protein n=1 Tax=Esox lucius TaxID=8010 RepID=A0A3P8Z375_ESOLU
MARTSLPSLLLYGLSKLNLLLNLIWRIKLIAFEEDSLYILTKFSVQDYCSFLKYCIISAVIVVLCVSGLFPVLFIQSQTMVVHRGESITLLCSNISMVVGHVAWFKQVNRSEPVCISTMYTSHSSTVDYYLENRHFKMYSNNTTIFLEITELEIADSGLYFCGFFSNTKNMVFVNATCLNVQGKTLDFDTHYILYSDCKGTTCLVDLFPLVVFLGGVTAVLLIVIILLFLKVRQHANTVCFLIIISTLQNTAQDTDYLNYAALNFQQKRQITNRSAQSQRMDTTTNVVYAATR